VENGTVCLSTLRKCHVRPQSVCKKVLENCTVIQFKNIIGNVSEIEEGITVSMNCKASHSLSGRLIDTPDHSDQVYLINLIVCVLIT
jgi:hypothetical protein